MAQHAYRLLTFIGLSVLLVSFGLFSSAQTIEIDEHGDSMLVIDTSTVNLTLATDDRRDLTIYNNGGRRHPFRIQVFPSNEDGIVTASLIDETTISDQLDLTINRRSSETLVLSLKAAQCITICRESVTIRAENLDTGTTEEQTIDVLIERKGQQVVSSALLPLQILVLVLGAAMVIGRRDHV